MASWKQTLYLSLLSCTLCVAVILGFYYSIRDHQNRDHITLYGNVDVRQVDIGFRVPGQVTRLFFEEGDFVRQGSLMALLDVTPYEDEVRRAGSVAEAIRVNLQNTEVLLKRREELFPIGGVSREDLDNVRTDRDKLQADLLAAQAALSVAEDNLSYTKAIAPTDGVILTRIREPGSVVNASDPVYMLSVSSPVWIRAFVDEPRLGKIYFGMEAEVRTDTKSGKVYKGKIGFISPMAEFTPKTVQTAELRTDLVYRLRVYVDHPDEGLKQGMPVTVIMHDQQSSR